MALKTTVQEIGIFIEKKDGGGVLLINPVMAALGALEAAREALDKTVEYADLAAAVGTVQGDLIHRAQRSGEIHLGLSDDD